MLINKPYKPLKINQRKRSIATSAEILTFAALVLKHGKVAPIICSILWIETR